MHKSEEVKTIGLNNEEEVKTTGHDVPKYKRELIISQIFVFIIFHIIALFAVINVIINRTSIWVTVYFFILGYLSIMGLMCGAHRLWSHRSFKPNFPLKVLLMVFQTLAFQVSILDWSRDHRVHHKFSDTDADPYNSRRGLFFSHIGWLLVKKHPDVKGRGKVVDMSDLKSDPLIMFQHKYFYHLVLLIWGIIPIASAMYFFNISFFHAFSENSFRWILFLHLIWSINSFAHLYGMTPYDASIRPRNNIYVIFTGAGEGYHNYHHVFPYDYSSSEFGVNTNWNPSTAFIDFFYWIGWATDLKKAPKEVIKARIERTGDGLMNHNENKSNIFQLIIHNIIGFLGALSPLLILLFLRTIYLCVF